MCLWNSRKAVRFQINNMIDFYVVGIALGTAWAHPSTGDTVASVMIGGLKTVQNGAFPVHTNDLLCIYFDDERDFFEVRCHPILRRLLGRHSCFYFTAKSNHPR